MPPRKRTKPTLPTLAEAVEAGDYLEILLAQRHDLVTDLVSAAGSRDPYDDHVEGR